MIPDGGTSAWGLVAIAIAVYASTNLDDLLLLAVFFADPRVRVSAVVAGRYVGLAALLIGSGGAALLALAIPPQWVALLGFVPLFLGLRLLPALYRGGGDEASDPDAAVATEQPQHGFTAQTLSVAGVTLANGGDNFGVYIPFFAATPRAIPAYLVVFIVMTALWCALGYFIVNNPLLGARIRKHGRVLLPLVLVALGLYILSGALPSGFDLGDVDADQQRSR
jgi:cadmium resistance protein CadD (predicted permease)